MKTEIKNKQFLLDGKPFRILSGEMHYFRIPREYWRDRLLKLKACGLNTVATYMPWNLHERTPGKFDFSGMLDVRAFLELADELGIKVLLRPGPYICSEWEFGGFPAWLLAVKGLRLRCSESQYMGFVERYFKAVFEQVKEFYTRNIIMFQEADSLIVGYQWGCWEYASALYRLLDKGISAIVAASETQMMKIFHLLSEVGVRVPQDVSLAGWLDSMDLSSGLPVTGIMQNYARLAQESMEMLCKLLRKERVEKDCIVDYQFIAGGSTLPLKKGQTDFPRRRRNFPSGDSLLLLEKSSAGVI